MITFNKKIRLCLKIYFLVHKNFCFYAEKYILK